MYAVVEISGQQFKIEEGQTIFVHRLDAQEGQSVTFNSILLVARENEVLLGEPKLSGSVSATVLEHVKGDKVIVFKKKRRKGYRVKKGHRQAFTRLRIDAISA